jgi:hypothetical protein
VHLGILIGSLFVLLIGLLSGRAENITHGQTSEFDPQEFDPLQTDCVPYNDEHIVIIKMNCDQEIPSIIYYVNQGYEIKAVWNSLMYLTK